MMWQWRYRSLDGYAAKAGAYAKMNKGLQQREMDEFYKLLGMRSLVHSKGANLRHALHWTPVIFTDVNQTSGHAMVLAGHAGGKYTVINPCAVQRVDFETDGNTCEAGTLIRTESEVEQPLGSFIWYW
jgi:hypothetical protein